MCGRDESRNVGGFSKFLHELSHGPTLNVVLRIGVIMPTFPNGFAHSKKHDRPRFASGQRAGSKKILPKAEQPKPVQENWAKWTKKYEVYGEAVGPCGSRRAFAFLPAHEHAQHLDLTT